LNVLLTKTVE
jgi:galactokinase